MSDLKPALRLLISHVDICQRQWQPGTSISYGGTFVLRKGDAGGNDTGGLWRWISPWISIQQRLCTDSREAERPILGRICMDQFMVDVTGDPGCKIREIWLFWWEQTGKNEIRVEDIKRIKRHGFPL